MKPIASIGMILLLCLMVVQSPQTVFAGGFGVSGTFAGHEYKMVAGETSSTANVTVIFYNQYDIDIDIRLNTEAPLGVKFLNLQDEYSISANSQLRIPITIRLDEVITPGSYVLNVYAQVLPSNDEGITLIGSAGLQANLVVLGEAGMVNISVVSVNGLAFPAILELFRMDDETLVFVALNELEIVTQYAASDYLIKAYYESTQVAEHQFTLDDQADLTLELVAQTLLIERFQVVPEFDDSSKVLTTAQIHFELDNIYKPVDDVSVVLRVIHDQTPIEEVDLLQASVVNVGSTTGQVTYYPEQGWKAGEYRFELVLHNLDESMESITSHTYLVPRTVIDQPGLLEGRSIWFFALIGLGGFALIGGGWMIVRSRKRPHTKLGSQQAEKTTTFSNEK